MDALVCIGLILQVLFLGIVVAVALFVASRMKRRIREVEQDSLELAGELAAIRTQLDELTGASGEAAEPSVAEPKPAEPALVGTPTEEQAPAEEAAPAPEEAEVLPSTEPVEEIESQPQPEALTEEQAPAQVAALAPEEVLPSTGPVEEVESQPQPEAFEAAIPKMGKIPRAAGQPVPEPSPILSASAPAALEAPSEPALAEADAAGGEPSAGPPPGGAAEPEPREPAAARMSFEALMVRVFSWVAGTALLLGAIFFLKLAVEHGWLGPPLRMALGLVVGIGLLVICELRFAREYAVTANAMTASGIAILFATLFASHARWHLLSRYPTFFLMTLVTAAAVILAIRRNAIFIAILGMLAGFATPALLATGKDQPIGLFGYLLLLNVGLAVAAHKQRWAILSLLSSLLTIAYQWVWVATFLEPSKLPIAVGIFLVFPLAAIAAQLAAGRPGGLFRLNAAATALLPLLFAVVFAAVPKYGARYELLFFLLLLLDAALSLLAITSGPRILHPLGGAASVLVFVVYFSVSFQSDAYPAILGIVALFVLYYLRVGDLTALLRLERLAPSRASAILLVAFTPLLFQETRTERPGVVFGVLFGLLLACSATAIQRRLGSIHYLAAFFALAAEAAWSTKRLSPENLLPALLIYGGFGVFYLGVPILAERMGRPLEPRSGSGILLLGSIGMLLFLSLGGVADSSLWGVALLLVILNAGMLIEGARGDLSYLSLFGSGLSFFVLAAWWWKVGVSAVVLVPALVVVAILATVLTLGGAWAADRSSQASVGWNSYIALAAHGFLLYVATRPALGVPPWPLMGVLGVLELALLAAALLRRQSGPFILGQVAAALIIAAFAATISFAPWPTRALWFLAALLAISALSLLGKGQISRVAIPATALAAFIPVIVTSLGKGHPSLGWMTGANFLLIAALLLTCGGKSWHLSALLGLLPLALAQLAEQGLHLEASGFMESLLYLACPYLLYVAYPIVLGKRMERRLTPALSSVLASVLFLLFARHTILGLGHGDYLGLLPLAEAALLVVLLRTLLHSEEPGERMESRLALVAGACLGFVTAAIPMQLDKQWITIAFALEAAALSWLFGRIRHRGLLVFAAGMATTVMVRLCLNRAVLSYHPRGGQRILNWYLYTYLVSALALFLAAWLLSRLDDRLISASRLPRVSSFLSAGATILLFLLLNIEIADYYSRPGKLLTFNFNAGLGQDLSYTIGWGLFAIVLLCFGIAFRNKPTRLAALVLLVATILKGFLHDVRQLSELYRVGSFVGLALCLAVVALLLQRFVLRKEDATHEP